MMRIDKLYIKIFLYFIATLVVAELLVFGAFGVFFKKHWEKRFRLDEIVGVQTLLLRESVEARLGTAGGERQKKSLEAVVREYAELYGARVWIRRGKTILADSQTGPVPDFPREFRRDLGHFAFGRGRDHRYMLRFTIRLGRNEQGEMFLSVQRKLDGRPSGFVLGLLGIGLAFTLLLFPVSRMIGRPIRSLRDSALRIARGDLAHRAAVKGSDEIGELGRSFNFMAEQTERMIRGARELTAHVSHELRSPLARIRVAEELLRESAGAKNDEALRHLDSIRGEVEDLDELIGRILTLSKLDLRPDAMVRDDLDPVELLEKVVARFRPALDKNNLRFRMEVTARPGPMALDGDALRMSISNVLDNALKYTAPGGKIVVRTMQEGDELVLEFSNTHAAVPDLEKIFEPFFRGEPAEEHRVAPGTGLGLAMVRKVVELHGGRAIAENGTGEFVLRITLPYKP